MRAKPYRNRFVAGAILMAAATLIASPGRADGVRTTDCLHGFGYGGDFGYSDWYSGRYGRGYYGGNRNAYGGGSSHGYGDSSCVEIHRQLGNPFVIRVPQPKSEDEIAEAAARERLWEVRCHPVIRQDQFGIRRYHYAAPGCEYGRYE